MTKRKQDQEVDSAMLRVIASTPEVFAETIIHELGEPFAARVRSALMTTLDKRAPCGLEATAGVLLDLFIQLGPAGMAPLAELLITHDATTAIELIRQLQARSKANSGTLMSAARIAHGYVEWIMGVSCEVNRRNMSAGQWSVKYEQPLIDAFFTVQADDHTASIEVVDERRIYVSILNYDGTHSDAPFTITALRRPT